MGSRSGPESGNLGDNQEIMEGGGPKGQRCVHLILPSFLSMSLCQELDSPPFRMASLGICPKMGLVGSEGSKYAASGGG